MHSQVAQLAYTASSPAIRTPRSMEFEVLGKVTHRLKKAVAQKDKHGIILAIHDNRTVWTALAADVASSGNSLPTDLRARVFYLAEFIQTHSRKVIRKEASIGILLEINFAILTGLQSEGTKN